ncbi:MAG: acetylxylan esterase [Micromonosporaceae bacterium]|nr:acetylxylan esterase [Micromonosporaceae bacterium]
MAQYDLPLAELRTYAPTLSIPGDFAEFWAKTLDDTRATPLGATFEPIETGLTVLETFDVTFAGFGGTPVRAWLSLPVNRSGPLPAVVEYVGYGGGRGLPHERPLWAMAGYAHLIMDIRGQGSSWCVGETPDPDPSGEPAHPGSMTRGILAPETYYYRRVFADAVRAIEAVRAHETVDSTRIVVTGGSQGGGIALAAAGLVADLAGAMPDVPFLCNFPRAITLIDTDPYGEIVRYLKTHRDQVEQVMSTLSYFDVATLGRSATAPALFSVGLMDDICPPSTVFTAYNHYGTAAPSRPAREIREYPFNAHEGGQGFQDIEKMRWLKALLGSC